MRVVEESADTIYLVLPSTSPIWQESPIGSSPRFGSEEVVGGGTNCGWSWSGPAASFSCPTTASLVG